MGTDGRSLYEAAGGADGMRALAQAWHERVLADEVVAHAFSHGYDPHHTERLAAYFGETLGGPPEFTCRYGTQSHVVRLHSGNGEHQDMDDRAVACFDAALADVGIDDDPLRSTLHDWFAWATRTDMAAHPRSPDDVPDGLEVPLWSWDGLRTPTGDRPG